MGSFLCSALKWLDGLTVKMSRLQSGSQSLVRLLVQSNGYFVDGRLTDCLRSENHIKPSRNQLAIH